MKFSFTANGIRNSLPVLNLSQNNRVESSLLATPLDLLVVGVRWPPETFIQRKLEGLAADGCSVTVASSVPWRKAKPFLKGVSVRRLYCSDDPRVLSVLRIAWTALSLCFRSPSTCVKALRIVCGHHLPLKASIAKLQSYLTVVSIRSDVVHFEWNSAAIDFFPIFELLARPVVISCRGSQINILPHLSSKEEFGARLAETFQRAQAVHCVSRAIRDEAYKFGADPTKARIIRPAVDVRFFCPSDKTRRDAGIFRVITTGSLIWRKGYEYALRAIQSLKNQGLPLLFDIIGEGPERQRVLYTIHDLGLQEQVRLLGKRTPEGVRQQLQGADVFLLSSLSEGISNAVLEAMACGLPIVSTDCGGMREAISHGVEGFVVPLRDPDAIAGSLRRIAEDTKLRKRMGLAARKRARSHFALTEQIADFVSLYHSVTQTTAAR